MSMLRMRAGVVASFGTVTAARRRVRRRDLVPLVGAPMRLASFRRWAVVLV